ncbi:MAG: outer membrane protein assembly factor BamA [Spirochaetales bacterium]|nr:outer membrane protein assembly factor BamA [Spirochaetales bacterium]
MRKTITTVVLLFLLVSTVNIYSQATEWYVNKPIEEIRFIGLNNINETELTGITEQFKGQSFTDTLFWDLQSKLYSLNYFESIVANAVPKDDSRNSVIIEFTVIERPLVKSIIIKGNKSISKNQILESITLKVDDILNNAKIRMDEQAIQNLYIEEGYPDIVIESSTKDSSEEGFIDLVFSVTEGSQTRIKTILFSGNSFASDNTLKQQLQSKEQSFFSKGIFKEGMLEQDKAAISKFYYDSGYIDIKVLDVTTDKLEDEDEEGRNYIKVTYFLEEGQQWHFGGFTIDGNSLFTDEELLKKTSSKKGAVLNKSRLETDFMIISDTYYNEGYIYNNISRKEFRNEQTNEISFSIVIEEKSRAHIENIMIKGNDKTADYVILREVPLEVGDIFSKSAIMQGLNSLYNTKYFSSIIPEMPYGSEMGLMDLVLNVEEQNTTDIQFGLTFTADAGTIPIIGFIKWSDLNFLGEGKDISIGAEVSSSSQEISFSWLDNWLFDERFSGGIKFSFSHNLYTSVPQDIMYPIFNEDDGDNTLVVPDPYDGHWVNASTGEDWDGEPTQAEIDNGSVLTDYDYAISKGKSIGSQYLMNYESIDFSLSGSGGYTFFTPVGKIGLGTGLGSTLSYAYYDSTVYRPYDKDIRDALENWNFTNKFWLTASWDTRDLIYSPTEGFLLKETLTYTGGLLFGSSHYIKTTTDGDAYFELFDFPVFEDWNFSTVLGLHTQFSMILPQFGYIDGVWGWDTAASRDQLLYYDGMFIARGWGTNYDNKVLWDSAIDFTTPIMPGMLSWNTFLSGTAVWKDPEDIVSMSIDDFYFSLGTGIQIDIPSFPISFFLVKRAKFVDGVFTLQQGDYFTDLTDTTLTGGIDFVITFDLDYF